MEIEAVLSKLAVEAFEERVLCRLAGLDEMQLDAGSLGPEGQRLAHQLGTVVTDDRCQSVTYVSGIRCKPCDQNTP